MKPFLWPLLASLLISIYVSPAKAITVSGKVAYAPEVTGLSDARFKIIIDVSYPSARFETETLVSTDDSNSGRFNLEIGNVSQRVFIVSATCVENCGSGYWGREFFYSEPTSTYLYELATFFEDRTSNINNMVLEIGEIDTVSGTVFLPETYHAQSVLVQLNSKIAGPTTDLPIGRDPRPNRGYLPPQINLPFLPDRKTQRYTIFFVKDPRVSYTLSATYRRCCNNPNRNVTLVTGGQMLPNPDRNENFPNALVFNSDSGSKIFDLYPLALVGPIMISGRIVVDADEVSPIRRDLLVDIVSNANLNTPLASARVTLPPNSAQVSFRFQNLLGDPTGADLRIRIRCRLCEQNRPQVIQNLALSPRTNHTDVIANLRTKKQAILVAPLLLLD